MCAGPRSPCAESESILTLRSAAQREPRLHYQRTPTIPEVVTFTVNVPPVSLFKVIQVKLARGFRRDFHVIQRAVSSSSASSELTSQAQELNLGY
jgi:hypothetical protein